MALLHELLKEDQEPFHLKTHISNKRSELKNLTPSKSLQLRKNRPIVEASTKRTNLCKHVCFYSFHASPEARRSPFLDLPSPAKSPCKSPNAAVFLHIPSRTAALLVEAAMRIQKQQKSKPKAHNRNGSGLLGSFLKRLNRSKNRKRAIEDSDIVRAPDFEEREKVEECVGISCSCSNRGLSSADWAENREDFEASTSNRDFCLGEESRFCFSPFRFSLHKSPPSSSSSSSVRRTPEFRSPAASPSRRVNQESANYESRNSDNVQGGGEEEEKEQNSPVSVLDPLFDEEGESGDAEGDDFDMECSYENVQRAKQHLMQRLRRFEKLAELDPIELERKLLEGSDDESHVETEESEVDEPLFPLIQHNVETFVSQVFNQSSVKYNSANMKRLVCDLIVEEKKHATHSGANEIVMGRICNRLDSWRGVEFDTLDMMVGLDFKNEFESWTKFGEQVRDSAAEIELSIFILLVEELIDDMLCDNKNEMVSC